MAVKRQVITVQTTKSMKIQNLLTGAHNSQPNLANRRQPRVKPWLINRQLPFTKYNAQKRVMSSLVPTSNKGISEVDEAEMIN